MKLKKEIKFFFIKYFLTFSAYYILNLYAKTIRLRFEGKDTIKDHLKNSGRVVMAFWHQRFFGGLYLPKTFRRPICVMISQSRDGDFIADVAERIGWTPARGSSSRGGRDALRKIVDDLIKNRFAVHVVDGPTGPPYVIKPGLISMAQQSGAAICPTYFFYENAWIFNSWDRFMVPKPFSRVIVRFGPLESVPENMDPEEFERIRFHIEQKMIEEYEKGDRSMASSRNST
ncbi:MAG: lysophospholipid acyltransferase family protein [Deltaproteobacteria bacterium]|nr:lysophospholipid acyltransferase family protein [Deltaproteobacteria bacterium]